MILSQNGIFPSPTLTPTPENPTPGWNLDQNVKVTMADLAVIMVRALGLTDQVKGDRADPQNWVNVLKDLQVPYETIGGGVQQMTPLSRVLVGLPLFQMSTDPLDKRLIPESDVLLLMGAIPLPNLGAAPAGQAQQDGPPPQPATPN
jgi:hypothetical protein